MFGRYQAKTIELWFQADIVDSERRVLWRKSSKTDSVTVSVISLDFTVPDSVLRPLLNSDRNRAGLDSLGRIP